MLRSFILWVTLFFGLLRFVITPRLDLPTATGSYEAFAHLWVGGLIGAAVAFHLCVFIIQGRSICSVYAAEVQFFRHAKWCWLLAVSLSALELVMFLLQKFQGK